MNVFELTESPFSVGLLYDVTDIDPNSTFLSVHVHVWCVCVCVCVRVCVCVYQSIDRFCGVQLPTTPTDGKR